MATNVNFSVKITNNKAEYKKALDVAVERVLTMWGMQSESAAKKLCPVDTGLLRNSITYALAGQPTAEPYYSSNLGDKFGSYKGQAPADNGAPRHVYVGSNVEYAPYQELGTAKMRAQPYLRPAIEENKEYFRNILESELKKVLPN